MNLETFIKTHAGTLVVFVQGLGFVGSVMSLVVANMSFSTRSRITSLLYRNSVLIIFQYLFMIK
jgi:hypothetical protein